MTVLYDSRWIGNHGIGRFADEVQKRLPTLVPFHDQRKPWHPFDPWLLGRSLRHRNSRLFFSPGYNSPRGWTGDFVFTLHDLNHLRVPDNSNPLKRAYYKYVIRPACERASAVLTVSDYSKRSIAEWSSVSEERILNVGNGVGVPFTPHGPAYQPGFPYLLYVGSRKPHKNLPRLVRAYAQSGVHNDVHLLLSGAPDRQMQALTASLGIVHRVKYADVTNNDLLASVYRGAVGFLFPSLYEGFGLPPLEAMACGVPVLTSNTCSLPEVVGSASILVNPLSTDEMATGITRLVHDTELRGEMRRLGLERAKVYRWDNTSRKIAEILSQVTGEPLTSVGRDGMPDDHPTLQLTAAD